MNEKPLIDRAGRGQSTGPKVKDHQLLVQEVARLVSSLSALLDEEFKVMKVSSAESLEALLARKEAVLDAIGQRESELAQLFGQSPGDPVVEALRTQVRQCHELNQRNKTIANLHLSHTRKSLELLRSMLKMNDVPVYGASGEVTIKREKRDLGRA
ncbi:MAG: flagellar protein FlgN [Granulosicoccus sp.]|nr:flagellar protein FlgN [Granulosicoccus sp.]